MKVLHVITGLKRGGAETGTVRLLANLDRKEFSSAVISLSTEQPLGPTLVEMGIPVHAMNMNPNFPMPADFVRLGRLIRKLSPDIIHSHMYHANFATGIICRLQAAPPLIWSIHSTALPSSSEKLRTIVVNRACVNLSRRSPARIEFCSEASMRAHCESGYPSSISKVTANGFDTAQFKPDPIARESVRRELNLDPNTPLVGMYARFHPIKDHKTFLAAAAQVRSRNARVHFLLCGDLVDNCNSHLRNLIDMHELGAVVHLLGPRTDMARLTGALDVASLSSISESFPQVLGEAMACGIVPVATNVGDIQSIIGDTGIAVAPQDPVALGDAITHVLALPVQARLKMGLLARQRVEQYFSLSKLVECRSAAYRHVVQAHRPLPGNVSG